MNTATGLGLFLLGSFALVAAFVVTPAIKYYLGAVVIFLFMGGVFFILLNTIRQTNNMIKSPKPEQPAPQEEQKKNEAEVSGVSPPQDQQKQAPAAP